MSRYAFRLLNVFAQSTFGGNQLAVFEDGRGLDDATMQAIGRQFNLSEITFIFPDDTDGATARFRIFTPDYEMPFAGHPSLGTAQVVRELYGPGRSCRPAPAARSGGCSQASCLRRSLPGSPGLRPVRRTPR